MNKMHSRKQRQSRVLTGRVRPSESRRVPLFGGWLPLLAFYDPPCHRDGSPWDGREDPGFRITTVAFGWFGYGVSLTLGAARPAPRRRPNPTEVRAGIAALDERIRASRAGDEASD